LALAPPPLNHSEFDAVFQNLDEGLLISDREGNLLAWNRAAAAMLGLNAAGDFSRQLPELSAEFQVSTLEGTPVPVDQRPLARVARGEKVTDVEIRIRRAGWPVDRIISCSGSPVRHSGRGDLGFIIFRDVTELHKARQTLKESNADSARRSQEKTADLVIAKERAESADRLKSAFLATMSHELRTPLNSIIGFAGILLQQTVGPVNSQQAGQLELMHSSARHLLGLINDILDISKIEAGQLEIVPESYDVNASLEQVMAVVKPYADKKGLALRLEMAPSMDRLCSDRRRVEQVLLNLLTNAIKFTETGGVTLVVDIVSHQDLPDPRRSGPALRLRVIDTGMGIRAADLSKIFQSFRQLNARAKGQRDSSGLGLAISRRLADLLGAEIEVASEVGRGSVFTLTLPLNPKVPVS
jgi:PAS domain S-box-containing protein